MTKKVDVKKFWGELDWSNPNITQLYIQVKERLRQGVDINQISKYVFFDSCPDVDEYTLYDFVADHASHSEQQAEHYAAVMAMLRGLGAKSSLAVVDEMSPEEKEEDSRDSVRVLNKFLHMKRKMHLRKNTSR